MTENLVAYKNEVKNFKSDLIENLIDYHIDLTDFNVIRPFIVESIESVWHGDIDNLKKYLAVQNGCSTKDIEEILIASNSKNWPEFFENKKNRERNDFQILNNLKLNRVVFLDNEKEERRRYLKELKFCTLHHCRRSLECNDIGKCNSLYQLFRMTFCCCWQSYIWRLICYKCTNDTIIGNYQEKKSSFSEKICVSCCFFSNICCWPFHLCYLCDRKNYEKHDILESLSISSSSSTSTRQPTTDGLDHPSLQPTKTGIDNLCIDQIGTFDQSLEINPNDIQIENDDQNFQNSYKNSENGNESVHESVNENDIVVTRQPTKFYYTNKFFKSFLYIAIESKVESASNDNDEFYFWIKIPFNFNIDLDNKNNLNLI